jgi:hypothetical protein
MEMVAGEVQVRANIDAFVLSDISEDHAAIRLLRQYVRTKDPVILEQLERDGILHAHHAQHNLVTTLGRNVVARPLTGDATYSGQINYGALGSSSTAVNNSDTKLGTEVFRKLFSSHTTDGNNLAYIDFLYSAADTSGTYNEFGNFIDGTASADSGIIWSHILTGGWVKSSAQTLFVSCQYTIS